MKVQIERFHLNGHTIGFCAQTQKLELPYKTPLFTLAVKGLINGESTMNIVLGISRMFLTEIKNVNLLLVGSNWHAV